MILTKLILPLLITAIGLFTIRNEKYLKNTIILSTILTSIFLIYYLSGNNIYQNLFFLPLASITTLFCIVFIIGTLFVLSQQHINYKEFGIIILYFSSSMGVIFSNNFIELIIYWELLNLSATFVILQSNNEYKKSIALKYFVIHIMGGVLMLLGITYYDMSNISTILLQESFPLNLTNIGNLMILGSILINLAIPPFSSWLTDAYSKCSPTASIFLSIFTTKSALFILFKLFYGTDILIYIGIFIATYALIFSMFETSIRRILAMSVIQQLGIFIIAVATSKTFDGFLITYLWIIVIYKVIMFAISKELFDKYKTDNIYELKNVINIKSVAGISLLLASLQSLGFPLTGGFLAKTYISHNVELISIGWVYYLLMFLFAGVALNVGIKLPYFLINWKNTTLVSLNSNNKLSNIAFICLIAILQLIFIGFGLQYITYYNLIHSLEIIILGIILLFMHLRWMLKKEDNIRYKVELIPSFIKHNTLKIMYYMSSDHWQKKLSNQLDDIYIKISNTMKVTTNLSSRHMVTWILILFLLLYMSLRIQ